MLEVRNFSSPIHAQPVQQTSPFEQGSSLSTSTMSWLTSWVYSTKSPPPPSAQPASSEQHLLEQPSTKQEPLIEAAKTPSQSFQSTSSQPAQIDRSNRNKVVFGAGVAFFAFSLLITRRSLARKRLAANPAFYTNAPGHKTEQTKQVSGAMEALEALHIATLNVFSLAMMGTGGALWYLDINSITDARRMLRGGLGVDGTGKSEKDAEEDFEEWMATVLARKESKGSQASQTNERGRER